MGQGEFLRRLGIAERAARLTAAGDLGATPALHRLTDPAEMGSLFKVLALSSGFIPAGFERN